MEEWERSHGQIKEGYWLLFRTDWSKRNPREYANLLEDGPHTPGPDPDVMQWLVKERRIFGFGTETIGTDAGQASHFNPPFPAHYFLTVAAVMACSAYATLINCSLRDLCW